MVPRDASAACALAVGSAVADEPEPAEPPVSICASSSSGMVMGCSVPEIAASVAKGSLVDGRGRTNGDAADALKILPTIFWALDPHVCLKEERDLLEAY